MFPQSGRGMDAMTEMSRYSLIWSVYMIPYSLVVFVGSIKFIQFRAIGRFILELACWMGMLNACIESMLRSILWKQLQAALSSMTGPLGMSLGNLNPLGNGNDISQFYLLDIPLGRVDFILAKTGVESSDEQRDP